MTKKSKPLLTAASIAKRYVQRDGQISRPLIAHVPSQPDHGYGWFGDAYYLPDGRLFPGMNHGSDLIRLATPAEIRAGRALPVKERKAKEGRTHTLWCFEASCRDGMALIRCGSRGAARDERRCRLSLDVQCGPIFRQTITCPAWSPK